MFVLTGIVGGVLSFGGTWLISRRRPLPPERKGQLLPFLIIVSIIGIVCGCFMPFRVQLWTTWIRLLWVLAILTVTAYTDFLDCTIPNLCVLILLAGFPVCTLLDCLVSRKFDPGLVLGGILGMVLTFMVLVLFRRLSHNGIGYGDIKLLSVLAAVLGVYGTIFVLFISQVAALLYAGIMILLKRLTSKGRVPLGPFLLIGYLLTIIFGTF
ncbi:MAG: prepilin peptidase [Ruminococcaceae bacterium]|nr:prepilin peptidase [Oscillospiraceae bacterium]